MGKGRVSVRILGAVGVAAAVLVVLAVATPALASAKPRIVTELGAPKARPARIDYTGDDSAILGGFTRYKRLHKFAPMRRFGRLHWTAYNRHGGRAVGADWIDNFIPDGAAGTFHPFRVKVHVYRPRHGIFTRMKIREHGGTVTLKTFHRTGWESVGL